MAPLNVPDGGLILGEPPRSKADDYASKDGAKQAQLMQLDLSDVELEEIKKTVRHGGKGIHISFGKTIVSRPSIAINYHPT